MKSRNEPAPAIKRQALVEEFDEILAFVQTAFEEGGTAHDVESGLWQRMLKLGRSVYIPSLAGSVRRWRCGGADRPGGGPRGASAR
jgi:hypothetical protein